MDAERESIVLLSASAEEFDRQVLHSSLPAVVVFEASWSKACLVLRNVLAEVADECAGRARVFRMNVDDNPDLGLLYDIKSIPTLVYFVQGHAAARIIGTASKEAILAKLEPLVTTA